MPEILLDVAHSWLIALVVGKPIGIIEISWIMVRLGWSRLPPEVL
jgi:NhaA family Na+:H+ antiporter